MALILETKNNSMNSTVLTKESLTIIQFDLRKSLTREQYEKKNKHQVRYTILFFLNDR